MNDLLDGWRAGAAAVSDYSTEQCWNVGRNLPASLMNLIDEAEWIVVGKIEVVAKHKVYSEVGRLAFSEIVSPAWSGFPSHLVTALKKISLKIAVIRWNTHE